MAGEHIRAKVTNLLRQEKIQLWCSPYYEEGKEVTAMLQELAVRFGGDLSAPADTVYSVLVELQQHSLNKLQQQDKYKNTGVATLKIDSMKGGASSTITHVESDLNVKVEDFKKQVAEATGISVNRMVLIASGNVLHNSKTLYEQDIRNSSHIIVLDSEQQELQDKERKFQSDLEEWKSDAALLASGSLGDSHSLEINDQSGKLIKLPQAEKKALSVALVLHEKGRNLLQALDYQGALPILLEADHQFSNCRSDLLQSVDNYALLNMDICWCYVNLKRIQCLPDAERRLEVTRKFFNRSYGPNLERLKQLKGSTGEEAALFMRLHLIEGIVAFHKGETEKSKERLQVAHVEVQELRVNDESVAMIMAMGYSMTQARVALRAMGNNMTEAINYIIEKEQKKKDEREKQKKDGKLQKQLGKTDKGELVDTAIYTSLTNMGYNPAIALAALKKAENNLDEALNLLKNPEQLQVPITGDLIRQVIEMGFTKEMAQNALKMFNGNIEEAIASLTANASLDNLLVPDASGAGPSSGETLQQRLTREMEESEKKEQAYSRLVNDISTSEDDYLDINIEMEKQLLQEYRTLIQSWENTNT